MSEIHPREEIINKASAEFYAVITDWFMRNNLTIGEQLKIILDYASGLPKWIIRKERHPRNPNKPGGLK